MPAKNTVKQYLEGGFYHIYNRGVDKREIFSDNLDYKMFLSYLKNYLTPWNPKQVRPVRKTNMGEIIKLMAYCLMPNHFHLLIKQHYKLAITDFMRRLTNGYTRYFNTRWHRVGPLFQGRYKGILIIEESYLLYLTSYIHRNPLEILGQENRSNLLSYSYSSYGEYLGIRKTVWIHPEEILEFFRSRQRDGFNDSLSYQSFVEDQDPTGTLRELTLEKQVRPVAEELAGDGF